ncbi:hypothetical protein EVG20_g4605 [Dentipellis fragilis]|uniref:Uncharacterized protein n=1 Tax=Dentipellis fragilis TaxID=205917 RepID=A0A4Y9YY48_9AGAM|nr:hypothetical protein EVG20_g4605 [Dentipellis fragilis]
MADSLVSSGGPLKPADLLAVLRDILITKYFFAASLTVLLYDHILTLPAEVSGLNIEIVAIITLPAGADSLDKKENIPCTPFSRCVIMLVRVYALYGRNKLVAAGLSIILVAQTATGIWQVTVPGATPVFDSFLYSDEYHFCTYAPPTNMARASSVYMCMSLAYDTAVFGLTLSRTSYMFWKHEGRGPKSRSLVDGLIRDGGLYFASIFSINLAWVIMIFYAPPGLHDVAAMPSSSMTMVLIGRITLNLRVRVYERLDEDTTPANDIPLSQLRSIRSPCAPVPMGRVSPLSPAQARPHAGVVSSIVRIGRSDTEGSHKGSRWHRSMPIEVVKLQEIVDLDE